MGHGCFFPDLRRIYGRSMLIVELLLVLASSLAIVPIVRYAIRKCGQLIQVAILWGASLLISFILIGMVVKTERYQEIRYVRARAYTNNVTQSVVQGFYTGLGFLN